MEDIELEPDDPATFGRVLSTLKCKGSNILVVGTSTDGHLAACHRLLGASSDRDRLFVFTDDTHGVAGRLGETGRDRSAVRVVEVRSETGSPDDETTADRADDSADRSLESIGDLGSLGEAIGAQIEHFESADGGLEPAELRVCVASLAPILAEHDDRQFFRFLHAVTTDVRRVNGMGHYHLPEDYDSDVVSRITPVFDAVIEVRSRDEADGGPELEHRWHLVDREFMSDWLTLG